MRVQRKGKGGGNVFLADDRFKSGLLIANESIHFHTSPSFTTQARTLRVNSRVTIPISQVIYMIMIIVILIVLDALLVGFNRRRCVGCVFSPLNHRHHGRCQSQRCWTMFCFGSCCMLVLFKSNPINLFVSADDLCPRFWRMVEQWPVVSREIHIRSRLHRSSLDARPGNGLADSKFVEDTLKTHRVVKFEEPSKLPCENLESKEPSMLPCENLESEESS